jgi:hypothetical protein
MSFAAPIHPSTWKGNSAKSRFTILNIRPYQGGAMPTPDVVRRASRDGGGELSPTGSAMCKTYSIGAIVSVASDT